MKIVLVLPLFVMMSLVSSRDTRDLQDLRDRRDISTWMRDVANTVDHKAVRPVTRALGDVRDRVTRDSPKDLSRFVKTVQSFLDRLVPNKNFVQDLLGPDHSSSEVSREISKILGQQTSKTPQYGNLQASNHHQKYSPLQTSRRSYPLNENRYPPSNPHTRSQINEISNKLFQPKQSPMRPNSYSQFNQVNSINNPFNNVARNQHNPPKSFPSGYSNPNKGFAFPNNGPYSYPNKGVFSMQKITTTTPPPPPSVISKLPAMLQNFADDWFRREE